MSELDSLIAYLALLLIGASAMTLLFRRMKQPVVPGCIVAAVLPAFVVPASGQKAFRLNHLVDSVLTAKYWRADIDTCYITRPRTKWTLMGRLNVSGARIKNEGMQHGQHFASELQADYKSTLCAGVSYLGMSASFALNPAKMLGKYRDYELNFRSYGKTFGYDIAYQDAHNFKGWHEAGGMRQDITTTEDMFKLRTLNVSAYYVFNHRRFSYPAALAHSYIQRRSAGSFLLAASGQGQHGEVKGEQTETGDGRQPMSFKLTNVAIGAGYAYNYVPGKEWLLHLSVLPTYIVYNKSTLTMSDTRIPLHHRFPEGIITTRAAVVKQFGSNKFAGISAVYNFTSIGDEESLAIRNQKWLTRIYFGFRL